MPVGRQLSTLIARKLQPMFERRIVGARKCQPVDESGGRLLMLGIARIGPRKAAAQPLRRVPLGVKIVSSKRGLEF